MKDDSHSTSRSMIFAYPLRDSLYLNITNRCQNACTFCIRQTSGGVGYDLWLEREPSADEVVAAIGDPGRYREIVFCGYGEPLSRPEVVTEVARHIKERSSVPVRINTNGLADLFLEDDVLPKLKGLIETVSISLNGHDAATYYALTRSRFGLAAFDAILEFARRSKEYIPKVVFSVVRVPGVDIAAASRIAADLGVEFRVREMQGDNS